MESPHVTIVKSTGEHEPFEPEKLLSSLARAGASEAVRNDIAMHVAAELRDGMSTSQIYKHAFFLLKKMERPAAVRYSLRRAVMELGPSGFPFEKFIAEVYREKGFEVATGRIERGKCIEHEIDVAAWNENKLIFAEAKFHNSLGVKSDVKVALYVKARFDDLFGQTFDFGRPRQLDEALLITNTKFSRSAIEYGLCQNLKMVGWNYPAKGNLQDMIEDSGLHPLTCLMSLSNKEKALLLERGVVLAKTLANDEAHLRMIGAAGQKLGRIRDEIALLVN